MNIWKMHLSSNIEKKIKKAKKLEEDDKIKECKWQTFGCASAIASTSMLSVMVTRDGGMPIDETLKIKRKVSAILVRKIRHITLI